MDPEPRLGMSLDQIIEKTEKKTDGERRRPANSGGRTGLSAKSGNNRDQRKAAPYAANSGRRPRRENVFREHVAIKFLLSHHLAGSLIGNHGNSINEMMKITGADIHVSNATEFYPGTNYRVAYITGNDMEVSLAQSLVWEMIGQQAFTFQSGITDEPWEPKQARARPGQFDHIEVEGRIAVPAAAAGAILGRGGATIRTIGEESEVNVNMNDKSEGEFTQERIVSIFGRLSGCMNCTNLVMEKMAEEEHGYDYLLPGTTYPKSCHNKSAPINRARDDDHEGGNDRDRRNNNRRDDRPDRRGDDRNERNGNEGRRVEYRGGGNNNNNHDNDYDAPTRGASRRRALSEDDQPPARNYGRSVIAPSASKNGGGGGGMGLSDLGGAETLSAKTQIELAVPDSLIGAILGPQGITLNEIIGLSGASVVIAKRGDFLDNVTKTRLVTVSGSPACAQTAHTLIVHKLKIFASEIGYN